MTPLLISMQWLLGKLGLPGWGFIAANYYRVLRALLRIRVRVAGEPVRGRAVLLVSNHVSWVDIVVIGSIAPVAFVAKSEVRKWPLVGITAEAAAHGVRRSRAPPPDRRRHRRDRQAARRRHLGGAVRGRHIERRQSRAAVPLGADRRHQARGRAGDVVAARPAFSFSRCRSATPACTAFRWAASTARWSPGTAISTSCRTSRLSSNAARSTRW